MTRIPVDIGARALLTRRRIDLGLDAGVSLAALSVHGVDGRELAAASGATRLDAGFRVAPFLRGWVSRRVALFVAPEIVASFHAYELTIAPDGTVGHTPRWWFAVQAGVAVRL